MENKVENEHWRIGDAVLYKNNQLIAFNKPIGVPVQADKTGDKSLLDLAEIYCKSRLSLIHRLDRPASGVVLLAKNKGAAAAISQQFKEKTVEKTYLAIVKNRPPKDKDTLIHYLRKSSKNNLTRVFEKEEKESKKAELQYEILASSDNYHLLKINLLTGRYHQIRAQLAAIGSPIKGDVKYGFRRGNRDRSIDLHAWKLNFQHPVSNEKVALVADCPEGGVWDFFKDKGVI